MKEVDWVELGARTHRPEDDGGRRVDLRKERARSLDAAVKRKREERPDPILISQ
jgi:hypothetical protein